MVNTGVYAGLFASVMLAMTIGMHNIMSFDTIVWGVSATVSVIVPLLWTGICLPLTYWFGFHSAQTMGIITVIPMFYFVKYFENGAGFSAMTNSIHSYVVAAGVAAVDLFIISMIISMIGYSRKK